MARSTRIYIVARNSGAYGWSKRAASYHIKVYHGDSHYESWPHYKDQAPAGWLAPMLTNTNREPVHVQRSGRFVPPLFDGSARTFVVSAPLKERLSVLENVEYNPVVFERLVDLPMPELGDISWWEQLDKTPGDIDAVYRAEAQIFQVAPDVPEFHDQIGDYYSLLIAESSDVLDNYDDLEEVTPVWGEYPDCLGGYTIATSEKMFLKYPIVYHPDVGFMFREDAFAIIAPFLDLDYYSVAIEILKQERPLTHEESLKYPMLKGKSVSDY